MAILVMGVNHKTGPLALLERVAVTSAELPKALASLMSRPSLREAVVVSTCNRSEVYAVAEKFHPAYGDLRDFFCELGGLAPEDVHDHLYSQHDEAAVEHLFGVAAGLESVVLGESEILGQVRNAWEVAQAEGAAKSTLNLLFRHALETGKRARTETAISRSTASVSHAAVEMATERLHGLEGKRVLVLGAGEVAEGVAVALVHAGVADITVANRTEQHAHDLAQRVRGRVTPICQVGESLAAADVLVTCTGASTAVLDPEMVSAARAVAEHPLLIVDVAVPRDVAPGVASLPGVTLLDLEDLRTWAARGIEKRAAEADRVRVIVGEEVERFGVESTSRQVAPLVAQLYALGESVRVAELERAQAKLASLDDDQRAAVESVTRGIVAKLLHLPSVRLKLDAGTSHGERNADAVRDLFDLL